MKRRPICDALEALGIDPAKLLERLSVELTYAKRRSGGDQTVRDAQAFWEREGKHRLPRVQCVALSSGPRQRTCGLEAGHKPPHVDPLDGRAWK